MTRFAHPKVAIALLAVWWSRYLIWGQDMPVLIHDNLDSNFIWTKLLADNHLIFADGAQIVPNMMGGLPRDSFDSEFDAIVWLYGLLPPFPAYVVNLLLMSATAFVGMWLLITHHLLEPAEPGSQADLGNRLIATWVAFSFALLPFWPGGGLTLAGLPLALHAFLNIRKHGGHAADWLIIVLLPFYSSLVLNFAFFLLLGLIFLRDLLAGRARPIFVVATFAMFASYALVEHRLIRNMLFRGGAESHRAAFVGTLLPPPAALREAAANFIGGQYHAASVHTYVILPVTLAAVLLCGRGSARGRVLTQMFVLCLLASVVYGLLRADFMLPARARFPVLRTFNFGRVHFMHPLLWYASFALALSLLQARWPRVPQAVWMLPVIAQVLVLIVVGQSHKVIGGDRIAYRAFYASDMFDQVKAFIGAPPASYRVISLGIDPAVSLYNGLYTLDGYSANYPRAYKDAFRTIVAPELARDKLTRDYFDGWGSRAYLFSQELWSKCKVACTKQLARHVHDLRLDTQALAALGGKYVISSVRIDNPERRGLHFLRLFQAESSAWDVYLYAVTP